MNAKWSVTAIVVLLAIAASSQSFAQRGRGYRGNCVFNQPVIALGPELSKELRENVLLMREEEKLARDVYRTLSEKYNSAIFSRIASAETRHMAAMKRLIENYGLEDPLVQDTRGEFATLRLTSLYAELVADGSKSLTDAYRVGALIEELDISDLIDGEPHATQNPDVEWVYSNLLRASRNHLRIFSTQLKADGQQYDAQHLSQQEFDEIANSFLERGNGRRGNNRQGFGSRGTSRRRVCRVW